MSTTLNEIAFEITQKCPNSCLHCSSNASIKSNCFIGFSNYRETIDDAIQLGLKRLCISGGEPFLHPDLLKMIAYAKNKNLEVFIYTSGITQNQNNDYSPIPFEILTQLAAINLNKLIFNMQAADEKTYNRIMGTEGCFDLFKNSLKNAYKIGLFTEAHFVPMQVNYKQINRVLSAADDLGIKQVSFLRLVLQGRALVNREILEIPENNLNALRQTLSKLKLEKQNIIRIGIPLLEQNKKISCNAGLGKLIIKYDGSVYPCEAFKYINAINAGDKVLPDNIKTKKLVDIWNASKFLNILKNEISTFHRDKTISCETCPAQWKINHQIELDKFICNL